MNLSDNFATLFFELPDFVNPGHRASRNRPTFPIFPAFEVVNVLFDANTVSVVTATTMCAPELPAKTTQTDCILF
jgi:hypothetical protein